MFVLDHAAAFVQPAKIAFPSMKLVQCYPHIIWKFKLNKKGNGC